jgi:hypothetical protein
MPKSESAGMSDIARPGFSKNAGADRLGPVVFECRNRSWVNLQRALDQSRAGTLVFLGVAGSLCISVWALLVSVVVLRLAGFDVEKLNNNKTMLWGFIGVSSSLCCSVIYWSTFRRRRRPRISLALHQHGIRYKRKTLRFDELRAIRIGRESRIDRGDSRQVVESAEAGNADSLTFVLEDGRIFSLRGIARRCESEDFKQFMGLLWDGHADLIEGAPPPSRDERIG